MNTTLHLNPNEAVKVFTFGRAAPFTALLQAVPGAPLAQGAADATGVLTLDLPQRTDLLVQRADGRGLLVNNGITRKVDP